LEDVEGCSLSVPSLARSAGGVKKGATGQEEQQRFAGLAGIFLRSFLKHDGKRPEAVVY